MADQLYWNPSTLVLPLGGGIFRLFQAYDRRNVLVNAATLAWIDTLVGGCDAAAAQQRFEQSDPPIALADATAFSMWDHAYSNSDFLDRSVTAADVQPQSWEDARDVLCDARIVLTAWPPPTDYDKRHYGDRFRGSFYEQIATESLFNRTTPTAWWTDQKFTVDRFAIRETPYQFIEERFLTSYFQEHFAGKSVLEIGCGTGYFTAKIAQHAQRAVGIDYNQEYLDVAARNWTREHYPNLEFQHGDIIDLSRSSSSFAREAFDYVVLIDTFLFLFDTKYQGALYEHREAIMSNLRKLVKPGGLLLVMDPHPLWLTPWIGGPTNPVGILTEYRERRLKVIPTLEEMTGFLCDNGVRLKRVLEPRIDEQYASVDPQAHTFMTNIPQWWFMEIEAHPALAAQVEFERTTVAEVREKVRATASGPKRTGYEHVSPSV